MVICNVISACWFFCSQFFFVLFRKLWCWTWAALEDFYCDLNVCISRRNENSHSFPSGFFQKLFTESGILWSILKFLICAFSFKRFEISGEFQQENSYISASEEWILDQRPDLDRLLNFTIKLLRTNSDLRAKYWPKVAAKPKVAKKLLNILMPDLKTKFGKSGLRWKVKKITKNYLNFRKTKYKFQPEEG